MASRTARRKIVLLYYERSNLPCEFPKWSNVPVKFLRSNVVKFSLRIKIDYPAMCARAARVDLELEVEKKELDGASTAWLPGFAPRDVQLVVRLT